MKKLLMTMVIVCLASTAWATATLKTKVTVSPDTLIPGTTFVGTFIGPEVTLEKAYLTSIGVVDGSSVSVKIRLGSFTGNYCPNLSTSEYGKFGTEAFKKINDSYKTWGRDNSSSTPSLTYSPNSLTINSKYITKIRRVEYQSISDTTCGAKDRLYPRYSFTLDLSIPSSEFDSAALDFWGGNLVIHYTSGGTTQ